jgi:hypothetical protein
MNSNSNAKNEFNASKEHLTGIIGLFAHDRAIEDI